jgi:hypothetical protein
VVDVDPDFLRFFGHRSKDAPLKIAQVSRPKYRVAEPRAHAASGRRRAGTAVGS